MERLGLKGAFSVGAINFWHVLINCSNDEDYARLWMRQIWTFEGMPMRVLKWSPEFSITEESPIAPVWVNLPGLPIHLFDKMALFSIARLLRSPLKIDETTAKRNRPGCARICVELDLTQKRIMEIWIGEDNRGFAQKVIYENLPKYCLGCRHIGHDLSTCYAKNRGGLKHTENSQNDLREILDKKRRKQVAEKQDKQGMTSAHETGTSGVVKQSIQGQTAALDEERRDIDNSTPAEMDNDELQAEQIGVENVTLLDDVNRQITVGDHSATITPNKSGGMQEVVDQSLHRGIPEQNLMAETEQHLMAKNVLLADAENEQHVLDERTESQIQLDDFQEAKSKGTGGGYPRHHSMEEFQQTIFDCGLIDIGFEGSQFTWTNKRIWQRLDRVFFSREWLECFQDTKGLFKLKEKLHRLKQRLGWWNRTKVGDIFQQTKEAESLATEAEINYDRDPTEANLITMNRASTRLNRALTLEEDYWRQKAACRWAVEGERNTKYFHSLVKKKRNKNKVHRIHEGDVIVTDPVIVQESAVRYFEDVLGTTEQCDLNSLEDLIP
ncbi:UNVERIFIED_CONTAM: hypothetical protein Scaly_0083600 [Sesamum calycinum]|uniref:DUF4283 domain-containing protein n=1 Tax=Sesamum calycinum TaxID=2727403 RepID=A0AAW2SW08_9LAMI